MKSADYVDINIGDVVYFIIFDKVLCGHVCEINERFVEYCGSSPDKVSVKGNFSICQVYSVLPDCVYYSNSKAIKKLIIEYKEKTKNKIIYDTQYIKKLNTDYKNAVILELAGIK